MAGTLLTLPTIFQRATEGEPRLRFRRRSAHIRSSTAESSALQMQPLASDASGRTTVLPLHRFRPPQPMRVLPSARLQYVAATLHPPSHAGASSGDQPSSLHPLPYPPPSFQRNRDDPANLVEIADLADCPHLDLPDRWPPAERGAMSSLWSHQEGGEQEGLVLLATARHTLPLAHTRAPSLPPQLLSPHPTPLQPTHSCDCQQLPLVTGH